MTLVDQVALGIYIGILTGIFTALLVFALAFGFKYVAGVDFPAMYGLMIGLGSAGLQGGLIGLLRNPDLLGSPTIVVALLVVLLIALYSHQKGKDLGGSIPPKTVLLSKLRRKTLSPEVVKGMGRFGQVRIRVAGEVADMEGYPPLPDDLRAEIRDEEWSFPADLPIAELETRLAEKLRSGYDLDDVAVTIDARGHATIAAAPPSSGLSRRVPGGKRAVTLDPLVPSGLARGDAVTVDLGDGSVEGAVVSVKVPDGGQSDESSPEGPAEDDGEVPPPAPRGRTAAGGSGRVALAVDPGDVRRVVENDPERFVVEPRGRNREYELVSLLRADDTGFRKLKLGAGGAFADRDLGELNLRAAYGVAVLAIKRADAWFFAPDGATVVREGDELFVSGSRPDLDRLQAVVA